MGAFKHSFEEVLTVLKIYNTKREAYEALNISKNSFFRYLRIMRDKGMLDKNYNIIEKEEEACD